MPCRRPKEGSERGHNRGTELQSYNRLVEFESTQITDFNLEGQIVLSEKFGLVKICRSDDGMLMIIGDNQYGLIDQEKATPASFLRVDSLLGFILDIGIQRIKRLTVGHGFYFGMKYMDPQSMRKVDQSDFDKEVFEKIGAGINSYYQSGDRQKELEAIKVQFLLDEYNNARLLFPNFHSESYLSLMRLIDTLGNAQGRDNSAIFVASISPSVNADIYTKAKAVGGFENRIKKALELFEARLADPESKKRGARTKMETLDEAGKFIFACFYSAYLYRNKFVHQGFPFPDTVKDAIMEAHDRPENGLTYLNPALGISWSRFHRPTTGLEDNDLIDIHEVVGEEAEDFKSTYFLLLPSWYFLKRFTKEAILARASTLT